MSDPITRLQEDVAALLRTDERLALVTIEEEDKGSIQHVIDKAVRGVAAVSPKKAGLVVIVDLPEFKVDEPDSPVLIFTLVQTITIMERPMFNRTSRGTQISAAEAVEMIAGRLQYRNVGVGTLLCKGAEPMQMPGEKDELINGYTLELTVLRGLGNEIRDAAPLIDITAGSCTLTGAGHDGQILYYTLTGAAPVPGGSGTQIYSGAFAVTAGQLVRASSIADDYSLSDFSELECTAAMAAAGGAEDLTTDGGEAITTDDGEQITA